MTWF
jgi:hypothetical protein